MPVDYSAKIDTELVQRETLLVLYDKLNAKITSLQSGWATLDNTFWTALGRGTPGWTVETIRPENFFPGTIPSLINTIIGPGELDPNKYPNICTIAYRGDPKRSSDDTGEMYSITLAIEVIVKSKKEEVEVNTRIQKTLEAINLVLEENRTLNGKILDLLAPTQTIGDVFAVRSPHDKEERWFFQGGVLEYKVDKFTNMQR